MNLIRQLAYDPASGRLYPAGGIKSGREECEAALGPRYIEFHPTLPVAYVVNELSSEVAVFRFNKEKAMELIAAMEMNGDWATGVGKCFLSFSRATVERVNF